MQKSAMLQLSSKDWRWYPIYLRHVIKERSQTWHIVTRGSSKLVFCTDLSSVPNLLLNNNSIFTGRFPKPMSSTIRKSRSLNYNENLCPLITDVRRLLEPVASVSRVKLIIDCFWCILPANRVVVQQPYKNCMIDDGSIFQEREVATV